MTKEPSHRDLKYDLKKPCKDCPFLKASPLHEGILKSLPLLVMASDTGRLIHTCHKTDPRSDSPEGQKYVGPLQHCAGLLVMMAKDKELRGLVQQSAYFKKIWKPDEMDKTALVWDNLVEMIRTYYRWAEKLLKERKDGGERASG